MKKRKKRTTDTGLMILQSEPVELKRVLTLLRHCASVGPDILGQTEDMLENVDDWLNTRNFLKLLSENLNDRKTEQPRATP